MFEINACEFVSLLGPVAEVDEVEDIFDDDGVTTPVPKGQLLLSFCGQTLHFSCCFHLDYLIFLLVKQS